MSAAVTVEDFLHQTMPRQHHVRVQIGPERWTEYDCYYVTRDTDVWHYYAWRRGQKALGLDIETDGRTKDGLDWRSKKIATIQVGTPLGPEPRAYVFCVRSLSEPVVRDLVRDLAEDPDTMKLGQNFGFEIIWLTHRYGVRFRNSACTQLAELVMRAGLYPNKKGATDDEGSTRIAYGATSMAKLSQRHLGIDIDKSNYRLDFWATPAGELCDGALEYAAGDVVYPFYIAAEQKEEIYARGLQALLRDAEFPLLPILIDTKIHGIGIDQGEWMRLYYEAVEGMNEAKAKLDALFMPQTLQGDLLGATTATRPTVEMQKGKNRYVSKELNYNAPEQVKKMIKRYCRSINWTHEVVITEERLLELKHKFGQEWISKRSEWEGVLAAREGRPPRTITIEDVPDYIVPRDRFVILTDMEATTLKLAKIRRQLPRDLVLTYLQYKGCSKASGTYGEEFLRKNVNPQTGRVHVEFHQAITSTGRLSSEPNLQNIPRDPRYRACFKPRPGYKFVIRDYSQIEPRLSAETSGDPVYTANFRNGEDIYCTVGTAMSGQTITKNDKALRQGFKAIVLGTAYNMGAHKLCDDLTIKLEEFIEAGDVELPTVDYARNQLTVFFKTCEGIKTFQDRCIAEARPDKPSRPKLWDKYKEDEVTYVTAPCGRKRFFDSGFKAVVTEPPNAPIQGCSATISKLATVLMWDACWDRGLDIHFVNYVHDELIVECRDEDAEAVSLLLKDCMEEAGRRYITSVPVLAEAPEGLGIFDFWFKEE